MGTGDFSLNFRGVSYIVPFACGGPEPNEIGWPPALEVQEFNSRFLFCVCLFPPLLVCLLLLCRTSPFTFIFPITFLNQSHN